LAGFALAFGKDQDSVLRFHVHIHVCLLVCSPASSPERSVRWIAVV
jgi:hypothetical protein